VLAVIILVTVTTKILIANRGGEPAPTDLRDAVVKTLQDNGFETALSNRAGFVVDGQRQDCHVRILETESEGYNLDAIENLAAGARLRFAYDGQLFDQYPTLRVVFSRLWNRMKSRGGFASGWAPPLSLITGAACRSGDVPWQALADIRQHLH